MIAPADRYGPCPDQIDDAERRARLRSLRAIVRLSTGPRGARLDRLLRQAEREPEALEPALAALDALASIDRRHVLASYAGPSALGAALDQLKAATPDKATRKDRERIVSLAWEGLAP